MGRLLFFSSGSDYGRQNLNREELDRQDKAMIYAFSLSCASCASLFIAFLFSAHFTGLELLLYYLFTFVVFV